MAARRLLDLFCGAGGAAMGYSRAGFDEIVGVDLAPQPRYPFRFIQGDALTVGRELALSGDFDAIHASPPCQAYSRLRHLPWLRGREYWDSIPPTLAMLADVRIPWILENVEDAPVDGIFLCGTMFGLAYADGTPVYRHRKFQSTVLLLAMGHSKHTVVLAHGRDRMAVRGKHVQGIASSTIVDAQGYVRERRGALAHVAAGHDPRRAVKEINRRAPAGHGQKGDRERWRSAMGIDWMTVAELAQAIPPAYTEWLGRQLLAAL